MNHREEAFTLIELLVVVIIIGILSAIAIPIFIQQQTRSREAITVATLRSAGSYMEVSFTEDETYPTAVGPLVVQGFRSGEVIVADIDVNVTGDDYAIRGVHSQQPSVVSCLRSAVGSPVIIDAGDPCDP